MDARQKKFSEEQYFFEIRLKDGVIALYLKPHGSNMMYKLIAFYEELPPRIKDRTGNIEKVFEFFEDSANYQIEVKGRGTILIPAKDETEEEFTLELKKSKWPENKKEAKDMIASLQKDLEAAKEKAKAD